MSSGYSARSNLPCRWYGKSVCDIEKKCDGRGFTKCRESYQMHIKDKARGEYHVIRKSSEASKSVCFGFMPASLEKEAVSSVANVSA